MNGRSWNGWWRVVDKAPPVSIRLATRADLPALEWNGEYTHFRRLFRLAVDEAERGRRLLLLAEIDDVIVGQVFAQLSIRSDYAQRGVDTGYLYALRVKRLYQNQGIGSDLIEAAEGELKLMGFGRAVISVAKDNPRARRLYERVGYQVFAEDPGEWSYVDHEGHIRWVHEPALVLAKRL